MNTIYRDWYHHRPKNYTGIVVDKNQTKAHYLNGEYHRIGGVAIEVVNKHYQIYFVYGQEVTEEAHDLLVNLMKLKGIKIS